MNKKIINHKAHLQATIDDESMSDLLQSPQGSKLSYKEIDSDAFILFNGEPITLDILFDFWEDYQRSNYEISLDVFVVDLFKAVKDKHYHA